MKTKNVSRDTIQKIRLDQISPNPNQARIDFDKAGLVELAESIKATVCFSQLLSGLSTIGSKSLQGKDDGEPINYVDFQRLTRLSGIRIIQ